LLRDPSAVWGNETGVLRYRDLQMEGTALGRARSVHLSQRWTLPGCILGSIQRKSPDGEEILVGSTGV
jgi:hypothetical protein